MDMDQERQRPEEDPLQDVTMIRKGPLPPERRQDVLKLLEIAFSEEKGDEV